MVKSDNSKGFQRYLFAVSLIVLFLGAMAMTTNAFVCSDLREFNCTATQTCHGEIVSIYDDCLSLCIDGDSASLADGCFSCTLTLLNSRTLLGTNLRGRTMTVDYLPIIGATGCRTNFRCTPCDGCCSP